MAEGYPVPYYTRLRILARQAGYFFDRLAKLDARFDDCPVICRNEYADPARGCPDCEYTALFKHFRKSYGEALRRDIERRLKQSVTGNTLREEAVKRIVDEEAVKSPTFEDVLGDFKRLLSIEELAGTEDADHRGGIDPAWSVRTAEAIRVIREERHKVRKELRRRRDAELDAELKRLTSG